MRRIMANPSARRQLIEIMRTSGPYGEMTGTIDLDGEKYEVLSSTAAADREYERRASLPPKTSFFQRIKKFLKKLVDN